VCSSPSLGPAGNEARLAKIGSQARTGVPFVPPPLPDRTTRRCYDSGSMPETRITLEPVRHVARLARLELGDADLRSLVRAMDQRLKYGEKLSELDPAHVEPTAQVGESGVSLRDDAVTNEPRPAELLANAPASERGYFKVPKIIE